MLGERIGVLGGGQLARMMVPCAHRLGLELWVLEKQAQSPAARAGAVEKIGDWSCPKTVADFASQVDFVTLDHEFVPAPVLPNGKARPGADCLTIIQDKHEQKVRLSQLGLPVPDYRAVSHSSEVDKLGQEWGWPLVLKARKNAYDGKGNWLLKSLSDLNEEVWQRSGGLYVEKFVPFRCELAVMAVRGIDGEVILYPVVETEQKDHICHRVAFPADLTDSQAEQARSLAARAAESVNCVGALGVEMFLLPDGQVLLNELAPRPHNSGHYTIEACHTSQFENHLRAVAGLPLGDPSPRVESAVMVNLLGDAQGSSRPRGLERALALPGVNLHLYQKSEARPGRKMGHLTVVGGPLERVNGVALEAAAALTFKEV